MTVRIIPESFDATIALSAKCLTALNELEATLQIKQNTAAALMADHYDFAGSPAGDLPTSTSATAGKLGFLNEARRAVLSARIDRRIAIENGRKYNSSVVDYLKVFLGRTWNPDWTVLGLNESLAMPRDPMALTLKARAYFVAHPLHEVAVNGLSAARATTVAAAIDQALYAEAEAEARRDDAVKARDESFERLRTRLVGLRAELDQLMEPDDMRWRNFGFARPIDRRIPKLVTGLTLRSTGVSGEILAQWNPATGAESYRVSRQVQTVDLAPVEVGLFTDRMALLTGLPVGKTVVVSIAARNPAGESLVVTMAMMVG